MLSCMRWSLLSIRVGSISPRQIDVAYETVRDVYCGISTSVWCAHQLTDRQAFSVCVVLLVPAGRFEPSFVCADN